MDISTSELSFKIEIEVKNTLKNLISQELKHAWSYFKLGFELQILVLKLC